jgi:hypothetical protein
MSRFIDISRRIPSFAARAATTTTKREGPVDEKAGEDMDKEADEETGEVVVGGRRRAAAAAAARGPEFYQMLTGERQGKRKEIL